MKLDTYRIKSELAQRKMNQTDLAKKLGISRQAVSLVLKHPDRCKLEYVGKIAKALDIDPHCILLD